MRITITADQGQPVVLGNDEAGDYITGPFPEQTRRGQVNPALRKASAETLDRKNRQNVFTFSVARKHGSVDEAKRYVMFHAEEDVPNVGLVEFDHNGLFRLYCPDAFVSRVKCEQHVGVSTTFSYTIEAGEITDSLTT